MLLGFDDRPQVVICRSTQILRFLIAAAIRAPRFTIAVALLLLAALASTFTYTGFLVVGEVAAHLGIGRFMAGLLLAIVFARLPWFSKGKFRVVGILPKLARRPVMIGLLALCLLSLLMRAAYVPALFAGFTTAFVLTYPWIRRAVSGRMVSSLFKSFTGRSPPQRTAGTVVDVEFREKKDRP